MSLLQHWPIVSFCHFPPLSPQLSEFASSQELALAHAKRGVTSQLAEAEARCTDLIDEMAQMNAELKRRGERAEAAREEAAAKARWGK